MNSKDKSTLIVKKMNEEVNLINRKFEISIKENEENKNKIHSYENIINEKIFKHIENIDFLKNKIFVMENSLLKKDNIIYNINNKLNRYIQREELIDDLNSREIYVYFF